MAWNEIAKDPVALLSAEAGRHPYDGASRTSSGSCPPEATNSCPWAAPTSRSTAPASSSSAHPVVGDLDPSFDTLLFAGRSSQMLSSTPPSLGHPRSTPPSWPAGPRPPTASSRPPRLIPRSRLNRSGGLPDMGNNPKAARVGVLGSGRSLSSRAESPSTSVSRSMATQAQRHRARRERNQRRQRSLTDG